MVELGVVEQRFAAVKEVLDGATVTDVARRNGVSRQTVHTWLRRYAVHGIAGLMDKPSRPESCPHQMPPTTEARVLDMRRRTPGAGARGRSAPTSPPKAVEPLAPGRAPRSIAPWCATA